MLLKPYILGNKSVEVFLPVDDMFMSMRIQWKTEILKVNPTLSIHLDMARMYMLRTIYTSSILFCLLGIG